MGINEKLAEYNLTPESYESLLKDCHDKANRISELDWAEISDKYSLGWNGDSLRKATTSILGGAFVSDYYKEKLANGDNYGIEQYAAEIDALKRDLERQKIQFRDQRNAWNKQNYVDARVITTLDILEEDLKTLGRVNFAEHITPRITGDNEMVVTLCDLHIGQTFNNVFGAYNTDIAKRRLNQYLNEVKEVAKLYNVKKVHIFSGGDQISGNIHLSVQVTNKENVIDQVKTATELISSFCYECTNIFEIVQFYSVSGNHTRIAKKNEAIKDERLDDVISWAVGLSLSHIDNFHIMQHRNLDTGIVDMSICGKFYVGVHGDHDAMTKSGVSNLCMMLGFVPEGIFRGHMHYPAYNELNGVKVIQAGSLAGSGDDHTVEMRLTGSPSQTICVCDSKGIKVHMPVKLN